jgi:excisionase family DNA binding protein
MTATVAEALTTSQVARRLDLSRQHTIRLARRGALEHYWTPLGRLFPAEGVERVAAERAGTTLVGA